jgi:hypothetical protein
MPFGLAFTTGRPRQVIGVEKSSSHDLSQTEIRGENPCSQQLSAIVLRIQHSIVLHRYAKGTTADCATTREDIDDSRSGVEYFPSAVKVENCVVVPRALASLRT